MMDGHFLSIQCFIVTLLSQTTCRGRDGKGLVLYGATSACTSGLLIKLAPDVPSSIQRNIRHSTIVSEDTVHRLICINGWKVNDE